MSAWDSRDADAFVAIFAHAFVIKEVASPEPIATRDAARAYAQSWFTAFPDMSVKHMNLVVSEDSVAAELRGCRHRTAVDLHLESAEELDSYARHLPPVCMTFPSAGRPRRWLNLPPARYYV
ncbi:MAG: nuclear transport factor 2 family protein, partial [Actinomycetota bacterium]